MWNNGKVQVTTGEKPQTQYCPRCSQDLPLGAYHPDKQGKQGHYCRDCMIEYKRAWRASRGQTSRQEAGAARRRKQCAAPDCDVWPGGRNRRYCADHGRAEQSSSTYGAVHVRLRKERRSATLYACVDCGESAEEWAYDHDDPAELVEIRRGRGVRYSADLTHYRPMCKPCHSRFDVRDAELRTPCMGPECATRVMSPFDYCSTHRPWVRALRGGRPGDGRSLDAGLTALVADLAGAGTDTCRKCQAEKPIADFARDRRRPKGYIKLCRPCASAVSLGRYYRRRGVPDQ